MIVIDIDQILKENKARNKELDKEYNPYTGLNSPIERFKFHMTPKEVIMLPLAMKDEQLIKDGMKAGSLLDLLNNNIKTETEKVKTLPDELYSIISEIRIKHDYEFWAATNIKIKHKITGENVWFILNRGQRKLLKSLERQRLARVPIRNVVVKARQWGGSTEIEFYSTWMQRVIKKNWNSCIVADVEDQAITIRGMYTNAATQYPESFGSMTMKPFENSTKTKIIEESGSIVSIGSMQKPESLRSKDLKIAHFSEVGSFRKTLTKTPEELMQSIKSAIPRIPDTLIVEESTAKGVGNYFHKAYKRAKDGESGYDMVFVAWHEIEWNRIPLGSKRKMVSFINSFEEYDWWLWSQGATIEGINWYKIFKRTELGDDDWVMKSENPTCIAGNVRIGSNLGLLPISQQSNATKTNTGNIEGFYDQGIKECFRLTTKYGYELECTDDHKVLIDFFGWAKLQELDKGQRVVLSPPILTQKPYTLRWKEDGIVNHSIAITRELGRFMGVYMGDGCYSGQTLSITFDKRDRDSIDNIQGVIKKLFNFNLKERIIGSKGGGIEIRGQKKSLTPIFLKLGLIEYAGYYRRKVCVPDVIWRSPKIVVAEFLKGLFDADGFNGYQVPKIGLFSKHPEFLKDIQLLLLSFGITSKFNRRLSKNGNGYIYYANTLHLMGEQADLYRDKIGFISKRKQSRFDGWVVKNYTKRTKNILSDSILSIIPIGKRNVFDIKVCDTHKFDAGGICVHNCAEEAFQSTGHRVFAPSVVLNARKNCTPPIAKGVLYADGQKGKEALRNISFEKGKGGHLWIWAFPDRSITVKNRYVVPVDIGGKSKGADWSVIRVIDKYWMIDGGVPEVIATLRIHIDQDLLAWLAVQLAEWYNHGEVVVENNSLTKYANTEGNGFLTILNEVSEVYDNLYQGSKQDVSEQGIPIKYGFHTNTTTKPLVINNHRAAMRDDGYIERDERACDEADTFENKPDGTMGSVDGAFDDIEMSTAIGIWVAQHDSEPAKVIDMVEIQKRRDMAKKKVRSAASF